MATFLSYHRFLFPTIGNFSVLIPDNENFQLRNIMGAPLLKYKEDIEDICISAVKEKDIEAKLNAVIAEWSANSLSFSTFKSRGEQSTCVVEFLVNNHGRRHTDACWWRILTPVDIRVCCRRVVVKRPGNVWDSGHAWGQSDGAGITAQQQVLHSFMLSAIAYFNALIFEQVQRSI